VDAPLRGQWTRRIARILRVARFKQQDRRLYTGNGLVAVAARDDVRVAWRELNVSIIHPNRQLARKHEEELVRVRMAMTGELAANSRDPHVVIVDDADRDGRPALSQARCRGMNVQGIERAHALIMHQNLIQAGRGVARRSCLYCVNVPSAAMKGSRTAGSQNSLTSLDLVSRGARPAG